MERREFMKGLFGIALFPPFLSALDKEKASQELLLIDDSPEEILPFLLDELKKKGLLFFRAPLFSFSNPHLREEELKKALQKKGWNLADKLSQAHFLLFSGFLAHPVPPSFVFIHMGEIQDLRQGSLFSAWKDLQKNRRPSRFLTRISWRNKTQGFFPGQYLAIYRDGRLLERLSLKKDASRKFLTSTGPFLVCLEKGKSWVEKSFCRQKICMTHPPVHIAGERIICAPNRILLEVERHSSLDTSIG